MLKVEHLIDYLKKGESSSETFEGTQHVKQITSRQKALRFKRSDDNPELPENFKVGRAIGDGDCFFDSVAQGLKRLKPEMDFTVKSLREVCKRFAQSQLENDQSWLKGALRNEAEPISVYVPRIEFTADDIEQKSGSVNVLGLTSPIWGRSEIEGRIICKEYNVKLHVVEKHVVEGKEIWLDQIVNSEGSRSVDSIDYNEENTIHIINRGNAHFEPILSTQEIQHNKQQSPDPSDYDDEITPEEELINIIKSRDSEEEKLTKIRKLFEKEPKPDINFQGKDNDTPLHIVVRKKELKVIEWLVKNGAKIDIKNGRSRTSLDIAKHLKRQDIVQILEPQIQPNLQASVGDNQQTGSSVQQRSKQKSDKIDDRGIKRQGKQGLHGEIYQLKLLMLFLKRGVDNQYSFRLSTEKKEAKKFDDLFFEITRDGKKEYRLLQAKHKDDESKKITFDNLLTESDSDYSLVKYFFSYQDSKKEKLFKNGMIKDVTVCTNINLDLGDKYELNGVSRTIREVVQKIEEKDNILDVDSETFAKEAVRYRFSDNVVLLLKPKLEDYNLTRLARRLAECFLKNNSIQHHQEHDIFKLYHTVLAKEVIDVKAKEFHDKFIKNEGISEDTQKFREAFAEEIKKQSKEVLTLEDINLAISDKRKVVDNKSVVLQLSKNFGNGEDKSWPNNAISDEDVKDFLDHLVFAVNQPNEEQLGKIIENDISKEFNFAARDYVYNELFVEMISWLNGKGEEFISYQDGNSFFDGVKQKLSELELTGLTLEYKSKVEKFGIKFNSDAVQEIGLDEFLSAKDSNKQVFNAITQQNTLSAIKVYQVLQNVYEQNYIFMQLNSILHLRDRVIQAFKGSSNLLIIECKTKEKEEDIQILYDQLSSIIKSSSNKKVVLITQGNDLLANKFKSALRNKYQEKIDEKNSLTDLTNDSQQKLLKEGKVIFQGEEVSLGTIINDEESKRLIDGKVLTQVINKERIKIGTKRPDLSDLDFIYYNMSVKIDKEKFLDVAEKNSNDMFVISGTTENEFSELITNPNIQAGRVNISKKYGNRLVILTEKDEDKILEDFNQICSKHLGNTKDINSAIHLIHVKNNELTWRRFYDPSLYIDRNLYHVVIEENKLKKYVEETAEKKDIFAVSGVSEDELKEFYKIDASEKTDISIDHSSPRKNYVIILQGGEESFDKLCSDSNEYDLKNHYNLHLLQSKKLKNEEGKEENKLCWRRSYGKINEMDKLKDENSKFPMDKDNLGIIIDTEKAIVIADEPGMGKSTALTHLLKQPAKSEWIIKLSLVSLQKQLEDLGEKDVTLDRVLGFFSEIDIGIEKEKLSENLLRHRIEKQGKVTLLFDGFDEISDKNQETVVKLLKFLKNTQVKVQVTTRVYGKNDLENALSILSYTFKPFNEQNQKDFLKKFWKASLKLSFDNEKIDQAINYGLDKLFEPFYKDIRDDKYKLMSVPLLTRIFAEVYQEAVENLCNNKDIQENVKESSVLDSYERFIEKKYSIYYREKIRVNSKSSYVENIVKKQLTKDHQRLAFKKLFPGSEGIIDKQKVLSKEQEKDLKLAGIINFIDSNGSAYFIHQTFAEYFAAALLADMIGRKKSNPTKYKNTVELLRKGIFQPKRETVRKFFDYMLAKDEKDKNRYEIHNAVLNSDKEKVKALLDKNSDVINAVDKAGRTALHLAAATYDYLSIHQDYSDIIKNLLESKANVFSEDRIYGWTPICYAIWARRSEIAHIILDSSREKFGNEVSKLINTNFINAKDENGMTPLHLVTKVEYKPILDGFEENIFSIILSAAKEKLNNDEFLEFINAKDSDGMTPLHLAITDIKVVRFVIGWMDRYYDTIDIILYTENLSAILSTAKEKLNNDEFLEFINAKDSDGMTALNLAIRGSETQEEIDPTHHTRISAGWHNFCEYYEDEKKVIDAILSAAKEKLNNDEFLEFINDKNKDNNTPLHLAVKYDDAHSEGDMQDDIEDYMNNTKVAIILNVVKEKLNNGELLEVISTTNKDGVTPLQLAVESHNEITIDAFLRLAIEKGYVEVVQGLLESKLIDYDNLGYNDEIFNYPEYMNLIDTKLSSNTEQSGSRGDYEQIKVMLEQKLEVGMFKKVCQTAFLVQLNFQSIWKENIKLRHS